jgi:uncharacterized membrane protein
VDFDAGSWWSYVLVFVAAAIPVIEILVVIPAGIIAGLHPVPTTLFALAGNLLTVVGVALVGDRVLRWWRARRAARGHVRVEKARRRAAERAGRIARRWGLPALAFLAPISTGTHVAALAALAIGGTRRRVIVWMTAGLVVWAVAAATATTLGVDVFK